MPNEYHPPLAVWWNQGGFYESVAPLPAVVPAYSPGTTPQRQQQPVLIERVDDGLDPCGISARVSRRPWDGVMVVECQGGLPGWCREFYIANEPATQTAFLVKEWTGLRGRVQHGAPR